MNLDFTKEVSAAAERIRPFIRETSVEFSPWLNREGDCAVFLKLENMQITSSFKLRGAANKLLSLSDEERARGVITASSGNHGAACAYLFKKLSCKGAVYLPTNASPAKIETLRLYGAEVHLHGADGLVAETLARGAAETNRQVFISPYNDPLIVAGQGTIALELLRQIRDMDAVLVPVGGGGLIGGVATSLKAHNPAIRVIGCQPENSRVMYESIQAGRIVQEESKPTLSDGTAGGIEPGSITFELCRNLVDDFILVTEDEIRQALKLTLQYHYLLIEGAAALPVAAFLKTKQRWGGKKVVLILSGARIGLETLKEVLAA